MSKGKINDFSLTAGMGAYFTKYPIIKYINNTVIKTQQETSQKPVVATTTPMVVQKNEVSLGELRIFLFQHSWKFSAILNSDSNNILTVIHLSQAILRQRYLSN